MVKCPGCILNNLNKIQQLQLLGATNIQSTNLPCLRNMFGKTPRFMRGTYGNSTFFAPVCTPCCLVLFVTNSFRRAYDTPLLNRGQSPLLFPVLNYSLTNRFQDTTIRLRDVLHARLLLGPLIDNICNKRFHARLNLPICFFVRGRKEVLPSSESIYWSSESLRVLYPQ